MEMKQFAARLLLTFPFVISYFLVSPTIDTDTILSPLLAIISKGTYAKGTTSYVLPTSFSGLAALDDLLLPITVAFLPSILDTDPTGRTQLLLFLTDFAVVYAILLIESTRRSNRWGVVALPSIVGLAGQVFGFARASGPFFALLWSATGIEKQLGPQARFHDAPAALAILPALLAGYLVPHYLQFFSTGGPEARHFWNWVWQLFPVYVGLAHLVVARAVVVVVVVPSSVLQRRGSAATRIVAGSLAACAALSASTWICTLLTTPFSVGEILIPTSLPARQVGFENAMRVWLQWDEVFSVTNVVLWLAYCFWDLKAAGLVARSWLSLTLVFAVGMVLLGPGAAIAGAWGYREWCLFEGARS